MKEDAIVDFCDYPKYMNLKSGDVIFINSDLRKVFCDMHVNRRKIDLNAFIDGLIDQVGPDGTIIFPTYNWDFCNGIAFDINKTPSKTGSLGQYSLKRTDFRRTAHPIYSFSVYGRYQDLFCSMNNTESFGEDSPFAALKKLKCKNYMIDVTLKGCFTYMHYAEQASGVVHYRYHKNFTADYTDSENHTSKRTYSMFVRDLDLDVFNTVDPIEKDFIDDGAEDIIRINSSVIRVVYLDKALDILLNDIKNNSSKNLCRYKGQC